MTRPYGISKRGISMQFWDLIDESRRDGKEFWSGDPWITNRLLTDLVDDAINDTIKGAKLGQDYLVALASLCNDKDGMIYTTPIYDVPVVQKKPRVKVTVVQTVLGKLNIINWIPNSLDRIKQLNGSSPNAIHSVDGTLLLLVVDIIPNDIGVIHDCFVCHANYGSVLHLTFKEAFVRIMDMRPLGLIGKQLDPEGILEIPYIGTLNMEDVLDSEYIIS